MGKIWKSQTLALASGSALNELECAETNSYSRLYQYIKSFLQTKSHEHILKDAKIL